MASSSVAGWGQPSSLNPSAEIAATAHESEHGSSHSDDHHEPVTAPDQHYPMISPRLARFGAVLTMILLPIMAFVGNHRGNVEKIYLVGVAGIILLMLIVDAVLRKLGLRN